MTLAAYHYIKDNKIDIASYGGELRPIDRVLNKVIQEEAYKEYAARARQVGISGSGDDENDALAYFHWMYNELYGPVIKTEYKNYGIYFTPVNLWRCTEYYTARVVIDLSKINTENAVIQVGERVRKFSLEECRKQVLLYDDLKIKECLRDSPRIFMKLPQIICFEESIKFESRDVEKISLYPGKETKDKKEGETRWV
jgi:hypothetical protein